ncbi:MAG: hypothetical protein KIS72_00920 [Luteimonas sp.]|nr:hypothetical protein [Luteimonas sp.]
MFSSSDLIEALQRHLRKGRSIRPPRPPGEFPPGWSAWFDAMREQAGRVTGAAAGAFIDIFMAREPLPPPPGAPPLTRWQAFTRLWLGSTRADDRDDRPARIASMVMTLLFHVLWIQALFWLMYARFVGYPGEEDTRLGEEHVVQVEFIGEGTPQEEAGGAQLDEQPLPEVSSRPAPAAAAVAVQAAASPAMPEPSIAPVEPAAPEVPPPPVEQPLQVTETTEPDSAFLLPPPRVAELPAPRLATPELRAPTAEVQVREVPALAPPPEMRRLPEREINVPDLRQREVDIVQRDVLAPAPEVSMRNLPRPDAATPELRREGPQISSRDVPLRPAGTASAGASESRVEGSGNAQSTTGQAQAATGASGGTRAAGQGASPTASGTGSGTRSAQQPGALPSPRRGDDWGDSTRNRPGGQAGSASGLFNADGTPRLAGNTGQVGGGLPPGTITEDYEKIDRMGTWPAPADRLRADCVRSLLGAAREPARGMGAPEHQGSADPDPGHRQAHQVHGGAADARWRLRHQRDPNLLDNEADARKPPDVPFAGAAGGPQESLRSPTPR